MNANVSCVLDHFDNVLRADIWDYRPEALPACLEAMAHLYRYIRAGKQIAKESLYSLVGPSYITTEAFEQRPVQCLCVIPPRYDNIHKTQRQYVCMSYGNLRTATNILPADFVQPERRIVIAFTTI
jgi:hypothetical protein